MGEQMDLKKQNILFFTRTMGLGGTENVILQLCEIFNSKVNKIVVCSCGGVNVTKLCSMGITHYQIPDIENKSITTILNVISAVRKIVNEEDISIIHTHHRMAAFYVRILGFYRKCSFLNTSHNTFENKRLLTRFAFKRAKLIACGEMVKNNLTDVFKLPDGQITVIHNAVKPFDDVIIEEPVITNLHNQGKFVVGNVGRLSKQKGMEYYINAIPKVISKYPNVFFIIVGSGEDEAKLKRLANDLAINENIIFLGYRNDIQSIMSQLDLLVLSSLWEGLPLTPIEAFSVGKTIVATAVDGTVEIVNDRNGILIEPEKPEEIAKAIINLYENADKKQLLEKNAKDTYINKFSFDVFKQKYIDFYTSVIDI